MEEHSHHHLLKPRDVGGMQASFLTILLLFGSIIIAAPIAAGAIAAVLEDSKLSSCFRSAAYHYVDPDCELLASLDLEGHLATENSIETGAYQDFGAMVSHRPRAVLYPSSVHDIAKLVKAIYGRGSMTNLTVAAKGHAHSLHGQAQAKDGVVVEMSSLRGIEVHKGHAPDDLAACSDRLIMEENYLVQGLPYVDVRGGELWADVLHATLKEGLAPKSWTDYLHLSVGGTLSNAGVSGQAFLHGPQISNVYELEVVTGKGDIVVCSPQRNPDLFYATLGGLGQFGIITRARVALEPAPRRVKWIRALYEDPETFMHDQEYLISQPRGQSFDYVEGFVVSNTGNLLDNWRSSLFKPQRKLPRDDQDQPAQQQAWQPGGDVSYYLEVTLNYDEGAEAMEAVEERVAEMLAPLHCMATAVYSTDISYVEFLDRVHTGEVKLRARGLWDIPHPWLNLLIPRSKMAAFDAAVFKHIVASKGGGPVIVYPMNKSKWDERTSVALPDEDVFYLVALLRSPSAGTTADDGGTTLQDLLRENEAILRFCRESGIGEKQYLPRLSSRSEWRRQFGQAKWDTFVSRKTKYDPGALLSPGQNLFFSHIRPKPSNPTSSLHVI